VQTEIVLEIYGKNMLLQLRERENVENQKGRSQLNKLGGKNEANF